MAFTIKLKLRRSLIFCLLLLLSICCSATDSFQQLDDYRRQRTVVPLAPTILTSTSLTITAATSINIAAIGVYGGGGGVYGGAASASTVVDRRRRWNIFEPDQTKSRQQQDQHQQQQQQQRRKQQRRRRRSRVALNDEEYALRKQEWADRYATLDGLRATFGSNKNKLYGDLDATTTRKLYKSLLPTAVCELVLDLDVQVRPEDLAQLAFEARHAAKLYARERCHVPARLLANWYDGFRALKRYGRFQTEGMSYDQVFDKYYRRSTLERSNNNNKRDGDGDDHDHDHDWTEEDIVTQTCMKILESACRTNPLIDQMTIEKQRNKKREKNLMNNNNDNDNDNDDSEREDLEKIAQTLEEDVRKLLDPYNR